MQKNLKKQKKEKNNRHVPMRMCAVTREKLPKNELIRFVKTDDGVLIDTTGKLKGRGLNMKPSIEIFEQAIKRKVFERTFGKSLTQIDMDRIKEQLGLEDGKSDGDRKVIRVTSEQLSKLKEDKGEQTS